MRSCCSRSRHGAPAPRDDIRAGLAELLADFDYFGGQGLVAVEVDNLLAGEIDLVAAQ